MADGAATRNPVQEFARYLRTETVGGIILLAATALALVWANSPLAESYLRLREAGLPIPALHLDLSVGEWAADGLLAIFFFVAGLELKRELVVGELSSWRTASLPIFAAVGGMVVPAAVAFAILGPDGGQAWAIPVATDIAFALGVLAITGSGMPSSARVFLLSLAVVDDLGAIVVIAVLFTSGFDLLSFGIAAALCGLYWLLQSRRIRTSLLYVPIALAVWYFLHEAGIHATIAGVALGLLTRVRADEGEQDPPGVRLEHRLQPLSAGVAVPLFALFSAGVALGGEALGAMVHDPIAVAVIVGLLVGKLVGILGFSFGAVKAGIADRPPGLGWRDLTAVAMLGGVGFTVSLLIAELAVSGADIEQAKAAVLLASAAASLLAAGMLVRRSRIHLRRGRRAQLRQAEA